MTDRFRWHPEARLFDGAGLQVLPRPGTATVVADDPAGLAAVIGLGAFRVGALDQPLPEAGDVPVLETLTSGSSGAPRRILRTQGSWIASFAVNAQMGIGPGARIAVLGRLVQSLSLYGAIEGLHLGAEVHFLASLRPDRQRQALAARRITHLYATPAQLRFLTEGQGPCPDLAVILVGGSKLDPSLREAVAALAPNATIREFYGAAETSFITIADAETPAGSVGRAYHDVQIDLSETGEIWVKSPYLFVGYAGGDPGPSAARWRGGWLSVGEVGRLDAGLLYLRGRAGRMVTVADQNVFPEEIEALILAHRGVGRAAVLGVPDARRGTILLALIQGDPGQEAAILADLRARLGPLKAPKAILWQLDWPLLASGKTDLQALQRGLKWPA